MTFLFFLRLVALELRLLDLWVVIVDVNNASKAFWDIFQSTAWEGGILVHRDWSKLIQLRVAVVCKATKCAIFISYISASSFDIQLVLIILSPFTRVAKLLSNHAFWVVGYNHCEALTNRSKAVFSFALGYRWILWEAMSDWTHFVFSNIVNFVPVIT